MRSIAKENIFWIERKQGTQLHVLSGNETLNGNIQ